MYLTIGGGAEVGKSYSLGWGSVRLLPLVSFTYGPDQEATPIKTEPPQAAFLLTTGRGSQLANLSSASSSLALIT
jgi:hypothetical protein